MQDFETMGDYLSEYNPFALKNPKGKVLYFPTYHDAYLYALKRIFKRSLGGYFDFALFITEENGFDLDTSLEIKASASKNNIFLRYSFIMIDWSDVGRAKEILAGIIEGLHYITESEYRYEEFEFIWEKFTEWVKKHLHESLKIRDRHETEGGKETDTEGD